MDAATAQLLISATVQALDLVGRVAEKQFDNREELDAYIEKRNELRERLVALSLELGGQDTDPGAESPESTAGEPTPVPEQPPSDVQSGGPQQPQSDQENGDAASSDPSQG